MTLRDFSVCNGCQSLVIFYNKKGLLTNALQVITRFVVVGDDRALAEEISYRTNNQNPVSLRDLSANDVVQVQLQSEFNRLFGEDATYGIKRGASTGPNELPNELAGQLLLALYTREPWSSHQKYRVFGDLKERIFRYGIRAEHIRLAQLMTAEVQAALDDKAALVARTAAEDQAAPTGIADDRIRKYGMTRFIVLYLTGEVVRQEPDGRRLMENPRPYLRVRGGAGEVPQRFILEQIGQITRFVVIELHYFLQVAEEGYDYKSEFKSSGAVAEIRAEVLKAYEKDKVMKRAPVFSLPA